MDKANSASLWLWKQVAFQVALLFDSRVDEGVAEAEAKKQVDDMGEDSEEGEESDTEEEDTVEEEAIISLFYVRTVCSG